MINKEHIANFIHEFNQQIAIVPEDFYSTFNYTKTGRNLTHPITLPFIYNSVRKVWPGYRIGLDVRLNKNNCKFQPDLVCFSGDICESNIELVIDYESPNSSDNRVGFKDVDSFIVYRTKNLSPNCVYIIITSLPNFKQELWQLRYASLSKYNEEFKNDKDKIKGNPFEYWYGVYRKHLSAIPCRENIMFLNISGKKCTFVDMA